MSAKLAQMTKTAESAVEEALKAEALANYYDDTNGTRSEAEQQAFRALEKVQDLAYYAKSLEDRLAAAEAKLNDAIDAERLDPVWLAEYHGSEEDARLDHEGTLALEAEMDGRV